MLKKISLLAFVLTSVAAFAQTSTSTYSVGNIPANMTSYSATCNGPITPLVVTIPAGATVTGIDITYSITAASGAWMSEQRSQIHCQETGLTEGVISGSGGTSAGTEVYNRAGVNIANGVSATGILTFEMRAWRTWGGSGCNTTYQTINNNSWTITVYYTNPVSMTYTSSTTTQASTSGIQNCQGSAEIIGVEIVTNGGLSPLSATQFTIGTAGTTNIAEVSSIDIYYTGASSVYAPTTLFGSIAPGGVVNITGSQVLSAGSNFFWVVYNFITPTTNGNSVDANCGGLVVGGLGYSPSVTNPAGNRVIGACNPSPGGIASGLQTWFDASNGVIGTPVVQWNNLGPNANIPTLSSTNGGTLASNDLRANYNDIVTTTGAYNGTFHGEVSDRTQLISGNEVTMYAAYQLNNAPDLMFEFHGSVQTNPASNGANQWLTWGFRHGGLGSLFSNGTTHVYDNVAMAQMSENSGFVGMHGTSNSSGGNTMNGNDMSYGNIGTFHGGGNFMELSIGYWPGYGMSRGVMEAILWDADLSTSERRRVETYLALKYGITLGMNGTSMDYSSPSDGSVIWAQVANAGYNNDIAGISRSDASGLDQRKSHSTNGATSGTYTDMLTIANGVSYASPSFMSVDNSHLIWGHNAQPMMHNGAALVSYPTDNAETIQTIFQRIWKAEESGTVGTVTMEFDFNAVPGVGGVAGANDLANTRLLIDEDGNFTNGATSLAPTSFNNATNIAYFQVDLVAPSGNPMDQLRGFFFTIGSTDPVNTPLPVTLASFDVKNDGCSNIISWSTASEQESSEFVIERSYDMATWEDVTSVLAAGNSSTTLDYLARDYNFTKNGVMYYRLRQVDMDGSMDYSEVKVVNCFCENHQQPIMYPNPATGDLSIESTLGGIMEIVDINGRIIRKENLSEGVNVFDLSFLSAGVYLVRMILDEERVFVERLTKQ
ncbi:MAG: T9SS type A sorting domain-containing protein [Crocinitomicaceae bacterium]|nr:T9SS type A sorting domain-containing protein [Crocinitomicaceae bacterium]